MGQFNKDPSNHTWMDINENGNVNIISKLVLTYKIANIRI